MATIVKASVPADQFALAETITRLPSVQFDAVRLVVHEPDRVVPLLWACDADVDRLTRALEADSTTADVELVETLEDVALYRLAWTGEAHAVTSLLVGDRGAIVSAGNRRDRWTFRMLFPERSAVSATYDACERHEVDLDVQRIYQLSDSRLLGRFDLTDDQFETIQTALESGYYEVPRRATLEDLSAQLGVSHQALSERLRRGHRTLIENVFRTTIEPAPRPQASPPER
jgi:predicted DNA binding protein